MMCKKCGAKSESEMCFKHKPKKPLSKKSKGLKKSTLAAKPTVRVDKPNEDHLFFTEIWKERLHKSEVSGDYLGKEPSSAFFHHILPKNKYPHLRMDKENIILLTIDEHANVESDIYKYEIINKKREQLTIKHLL